MASRSTLHPGQRALALALDEPYEAEYTLYEAEYEEPAVGQMELFPPPPSTVTPLQSRPSTSQVGDWGENWFEGACRAAGLEVIRQQPGNEGFDFMVCSSRVEVKATKTLTKDGRLNFSAGGDRRFSDYVGRTDYFAFVTLGPGVDLYGRVLVIPIGSVLQRWRGHTVALRPIDLPRTPDLSPLSGSSLAATAGAEARSSGGELVAVSIR